ncbi:hypothetical protein MOU_11686 [Xanthomonas citri pv. malvacearum str. GSPB1386]|nr:hypothetical protein MOU_11686 [Xanthomonas citri pv. malvacearum str. GSPB1386]
MPRKVPRQWAGKDLSRWSVRMVHTMPDVAAGITAHPVIFSMQASGLAMDKF